MAKHLRIKCSSCGHWNRVPVNKIFIEQNTLEPKVKAYVPMYEPLEVSKCEKCGNVIADPKELIRIREKDRTMVYFKASEMHIPILGRNEIA